MSKIKTKYIVTHRYSHNEYTTFAVSEDDAINNIHYKLWFQERIWTEMRDFYAESAAAIRLKEIKQQEIEKKEAEPESHYHQMTLFEVAV